MSALPAPTPPIILGHPLVSVIVPCFGEGRYLSDCLDSLRMQKYPHLEIVVLDDAGTDDSLAVALEHALEDERIRLFRTTENVGLGAVRNQGMLAAKGDLVLFLDGDDWVPPNAVATRVRELHRALDEIDDARRREVAGVFGQWQHTAHDAGLGHPTPACPRLTQIDMRNSRGANVMIVSAPLVRRDLMIMSGGFTEGVAGAEDHLAWMRLLSLGTVFLPCREIVSFYRQKPQSMLRDSARTVAAFGLTTRRWAASAPQGEPLGDSDVDARRVASGELVMRWGRPRRTLTRMAATSLDDHPTPRPTHDRLQTEEWPPTPPELSGDSDLLPAMDRARRFLEGEPWLDVRLAQLQRDADRFRWVTGTSDARPSPHRVTSTPSELVFGATSMAAGVEAVAVAVVAIDQTGFPVRLELSRDARRGAVAALCLLDEVSELLSLRPLLPWSRGHMLLAHGRNDDGSAPSGLMLIDADQGPTPASQLVAETLGHIETSSTTFVIPSITSDDATEWAASAARANRAEILTITADASRSLSDAQIAHRRGGLADIAAGHAICEDQATLDVARLADPTASLFVNAEAGSAVTRQPEAVRADNTIDPQELVSVIVQRALENRLSAPGGLSFAELAIR